MLTKIVESEHGEGRGNHGKFMLMRFDDEWEYRSQLPGAETWAAYGGEAPHLLGQVCGWGPSHTWVLDLQTGEGALFRPGGYAHADLEKHAVWVCPLFEPFLEFAWKWVQDGGDLWDLPAVVQLPDAPFAFRGYRRPGPTVLVELPALTDEEAAYLQRLLEVQLDATTNPDRWSLANSLRTAVAEAREDVFTTAEERTLVPSFAEGRPDAWVPPGPVDWPQVKWLVDVFVWLGGRGEAVGAFPTCGPMVLWRLAIYGDGALADMHWLQLDERFDVQQWDMASLVLLGSLNLLNCQNVEIVDYEPTSRPERRRLERIGVRTSVIHVFPAGRRRRGERGEPFGVAHHGVRGHFASYGPKYDRGLLFGKYEGRFYVPGHVRGTRDRGEIEAEYQLHAEGG